MIGEYGVFTGSSASGMDGAEMSARRLSCVLRVTVIINSLTRTLTH